MALFKIFKGSGTLPSTYKDGYCYFETNSGKMYIDTKDSDSTGRICLNADKADKDGSGNIITSTYLPLTGGTMTGNILFNKKGIKVKATDSDISIWTVYGATEGSYGFRLQYDGTGTGNNNSLSLIADNQEGEEVRAYRVLQDGTVSFTNTIDGNAATATILKDSRNLKIGNTSKSFNGSSDLTWTSNEVGFLDLVNRGTEFEDSADMNSVGYGNFFSNNSTKSGTLVNAPIASAGFRLFSLRGYNSSSTAYHWQFASSSTRRLYQRYRDDSSWSNWGHIVITAEKTAIGSATQPVYINGSGVATACTAYSGLLTDFSSSANTLSLTVGGTTKTTTTINSISNTWTNGTTAGPTITTTVNGLASAAVAIPIASTSYSGVVTIGSQRFRGSKTLEYPKISSNNTRYQGYHYVNNAGTILGEHWYDTGDATNFSNGRYYWRQWSPNSTADTSTSGYHETYSLPAATTGLTENKTYEIFTSKSYTTLDDRYVNVSGDTMTGILTFKNTTAAPTNGQQLPILRMTYQNGDGTYYANNNIIAMLGTAETGATNSCAVRFGSANGCTYITSGESGTVMPSILGANSENLYLTSDNIIEFYTVCANDGASYTKTMTMTNSKITAHKPLYGAVWNDYAEYRICNNKFKPGQVVLENGDDTLSITSQRLQRGCSIISDTFGFAIGETDEAKCPIAVSGRVLAYGYESREEFKKHIGWPVCSGPNGTVSIMTEEEEEKYPSRIMGTISAVPDYAEWGEDKVKVNERIWIKVK